MVDVSSHYVNKLNPLNETFMTSTSMGELEERRHAFIVENREKINPEQNNFRLVSQQDCHRVFTQRDRCLMPNKALQNMLLSKPVCSGLSKIQ